MKIKANKNGLYEFEINIVGNKKSKKLKGLVDTGSTDCACTYQIITTLQIRPIDWVKISIINDNDEHEYKQVFAYISDIEFDGQSDTVSILRVPNLPIGIDFILGMSFLSKCELVFKDDYLQIEWKK